MWLAHQCFFLILLWFKQRKWKITRCWESFIYVVMYMLLMYYSLYFIFLCWKINVASTVSTSLCNLSLYTLICWLEKMLGNKHSPALHNSIQIFVNCSPKHYIYRRLHDARLEPCVGNDNTRNQISWTAQFRKSLMIRPLGRGSIIDPSKSLQFKFR